MASTVVPRCPGAVYCVHRRFTRHPFAVVTATAMAMMIMVVVVVSGAVKC